MPNPIPPAVQINQLSLAYPGESQRALDSVSLSIGSDQVFGLLGRPGSGKTSLLQAVCGRLAPQADSVTIFGYAQEAAKHPNLRAWLQGDPRPDPRLEASSQEEIFHLARTLEIDAGILGKIDRLPHTLRERARLIPLLLDPSPLILLDEHPGLTPETAALLQDWLPDHVHAHGSTLVLATQHPTLIQKLCDRAAVLHAGRLVYQGPVSRHPGPGACSKYLVRLGGRLDTSLGRQPLWPSGVVINTEGDDTLISGDFPDQAALFGLLTCARDLGLTLISVQQQAPDPIERWRAWMKPALHTPGEGFSPPGA